MEDWERAIYTQSVQRSQPYNTNIKKERRERENKDKRERAAYAKIKAMALLLKPANPIPSNTGSARSFNRDTERGLKYCDVGAVRRRTSIPMCEQSVMVHTVQAEHCKECANGYT